MCHARERRWRWHIKESLRAGLPLVSSRDDRQVALILGFFSQLVNIATPTSLNLGYTRRRNDRRHGNDQTVCTAWSQLMLPHIDKPIYARMAPTPQACTTVRPHLLCSQRMHGSDTNALQQPHKKNHWHKNLHQWNNYLLTAHHSPHKSNPAWWDLHTRHLGTSAAAFISGGNGRQRRPDGNLSCVRGMCWGAATPEGGTQRAIHTSLITPRQQQCAHGRIKPWPYLP